MERTDAVGWLPDGTVETVRAAVAAVAPELAREPIVMAPRIAGNPPAYWRGTARVGGGFMAKFAWSAQAAVGVERELAILPLLRELAPSIPVPEIVFASRNPLLFITRHVPGVPAGEPYARDTTPSAIPARLADALAALHAPALKDLIEHHGVTMGETQPQATTSALRERFAGPIVTGPRAQRVLTWCDWIDDIHSHAAPETTVVHGDLHTHKALAVVAAASRDESLADSELSALAREFDAVLAIGLTDLSPADFDLKRGDVEVTDADIDALMAERTVERIARDFARSDELRDQLAHLGVAVQDHADGTSSWCWA